MATLADVLDPTGVTAARVTDATLAPRPADLSGLRIGLLENTKHNAALLLDELADHLEREHGARAVLRRHEDGVRPADARRAAQGVRGRVRRRPRRRR